MPKQTEGVLAQVRQEQIVDIINQNGNISVNTLCDQFNVSPATIRNDLRDLEVRGAINRIHGGAISCKKTAFELNTYQKEIQNVEEKRAIAKAALEYIQEGDAIALDTGTTTFEMAKMLHGFQDLTVVTNDLQIASWLENNTEVTIIMIGGLVRHHFRCTAGQSALDMMSALHVDKAFVAVNGISIKNGLSTPSIDMASIKRQIIQMADQVILLADKSKIDRTAFAAYAPLSSVDVLITDEHADAGFVETVRATGIKVICAKMENESKGM